MNCITWIWRWNSLPDMAMQFIKLDNVFDVIQNNSHECFSSESEESMQAFFDIMQDRDKTPEQRADILMNGTVRV